jgi:hypothetical protein
MTVSRAWQGHGSALFLEIGRLKEGRGELTIMIEWSWRVEKDDVIWFGSWSENDLMGACIPKLTGMRIRNITTIGRLPELKIRLSEHIWVQSFSTVEGHPHWALLFPDHVVVTSQDGRLVKTIEKSEKIDDI